jgi:hypothetical protein
MQESLFARLLNPFFDSIDPFRKFALAEDEPTMLWWNRPWRGADEEGTLPHLKSLKNARRSENR